MHPGCRGEVSAQGRCCIYPPQMWGASRGAGEGLTASGSGRTKVLRLHLLRPRCRGAVAAGRPAEPSGPDGPRGLAGDAADAGQAPLHGLAPSHHPSAAAHGEMGHGGHCSCPLPPPTPSPAPRSCSCSGDMGWTAGDTTPPAPPQPCAAAPTLGGLESKAHALRTKTVPPRPPPSAPYLMDADEDIFPPDSGIKGDRGRRAPCIFMSRQAGTLLQGGGAMVLRAGWGEACVPVRACFACVCVYTRVCAYPCMPRAPRGHPRARAGGAGIVGASSPTEKPTPWTPLGLPLLRALEPGWGHLPSRVHVLLPAPKTWRLRGQCQGQGAAGQEPEPVIERHRKGHAGG